ncbi:unnamed protein product [Dovyalis caffra]|uniref:Uncharacterized protein n=1 Tax=Dovyalis caffra TaxID=77055 RepID=A0AAV1QYJ3_9ROSI|nr:unnamed protein product [Dovyalis caffra]
MAAKRNRYQRQKSLMLLEMESQHAKGLPSPSGYRQISTPVVSLQLGPHVSLYLSPSIAVVVS